MHFGNTFYCLTFKNLKSKIFCDYIELILTNIQIKTLCTNIFFISIVVLEYYSFLPNNKKMPNKRHGVYKGFMLEHTLHGYLHPFEIWFIENWCAGVRPTYCTKPEPNVRLSSPKNSLGSQTVLVTLSVQTAKTFRSFTTVLSAPLPWLFHYWFLSQDVKNLIKFLPNPNLCPVR